jgi:hypothetical protein
MVEVPEHQKESRDKAAERQRGPGAPRRAKAHRASWAFLRYTDLLVFLISRGREHDGINRSAFPGVAFVFPISPATLP